MGRLEAVEKRTSEPLLYSWCLPASVGESGVQQQQQNGQTCSFFHCLWITLSWSSYLKSCRIRYSLPLISCQLTLKKDTLLFELLFLREHFNESSKITLPKTDRRANKSTACGHRMAHRKWNETKHQPNMLSGPAEPGCCLVSFHILRAILCPQEVNKMMPNHWASKFV